mmetsp:Transcript_7709/g.23743  ORF Transcript_7709/g.23743 Transcript_7709/m.23743 type:complete len:529 (-) Transcript_7709:427-2013(-)
MAPALDRLHGAVHAAGGLGHHPLEALALRLEDAARRRREEQAHLVRLHQQVAEALEHGEGGLAGAQRRVERSPGQRRVQQTRDAAGRLAVPDAAEQLALLQEEQPVHGLEQFGGQRRGLVAAALGERGGQRLVEQMLQLVDGQRAPARQRKLHGGHRVVGVRKVELHGLGEALEHLARRLVVLAQPANHLEGALLVGERERRHQHGRLRACNILDGLDRDRAIVQRRRKVLQTALHERRVALHAGERALGRVVLGLAGAQKMVVPHGEHRPGERVAVQQVGEPHAARLLRLAIQEGELRVAGRVPLHAIHQALEDLRVQLTHPAAQAALPAGRDELALARVEGLAVVLARNVVGAVHLAQRHTAIGRSASATVLAGGTGFGGGRRLDRSRDAHVGVAAHAGSRRLHHGRHAALVLGDLIPVQMAQTAGPLVEHLVLQLARRVRVELVHLLGQRLLLAQLQLLGREEAEQHLLGSGLIHGVDERLREEQGQHRMQRLLHEGGARLGVIHRTGWLLHGGGRWRHRLGGPN